MVWVKRLSPLVIALLIWQGYLWYSERKIHWAHEAMAPQAQLIAELWTASVQFRLEPERYHQVRDSLLLSYGITGDSLQAFLKNYQADPEFNTLLAQEINRDVDSLSIVVESLLVRQGDTLATRGTKTASSPEPEMRLDSAPVPRVR